MRKHHAKKYDFFRVNPEVKNSKARAALDLTPIWLIVCLTAPYKVFPKPQGLRENIMAHCPCSMALMHATRPLGHTCRESPSIPVIRRVSVH